MNTKQWLTMGMCVVGMSWQSTVGLAQEKDPFAKPAEGDQSLQEELDWLQAEKFAITASRVLENVKKSAASITVITDKEIEQMGARHIMDVINTIPGMSAWNYLDGIYKIDSRGLLKSAGQNILLMINSHPLNEQFLGGFPTLDTLPVDNIKQIEVIRGPGSALYGANAFAGVINIITKEAETSEAQVSAKGGNYATQQYNVRFGQKFTGGGLTFNANYFDTKGFEGDIAQDRQTLLDLLLGTRASLAPGATQGAEKKYDLTLGVAYQGFKVEGQYIAGKTDRPLSLSNSLSKENTDDTVDYYVSVNYTRNLMEGWDLSGKVYHNLHDLTTHSETPPGTAMPAAPDGRPAIFRTGLIVEPASKNTRTGVELQSQAKLGEAHTLVTGLTYEKMTQYDVTYAANFLYTPIQNVVVPLAGVQDITDRQNYNKDVSRTFTAGFMEDLWDLNDALRFTLGARYDHYSDFGGSFNPRAAAVWEFVKGYDLKILYGRAFRAPSFYELYSQNNPSFIGNPDLKPELINTYEVSVGADLTTALKTRLTGFRNDITDSIDMVTVAQGGIAQRIFQNKDQLRSQGVEAEMTYNFGKGTYIGANFTLQDGKNVDTDETFWYNPDKKGNLMANVRLKKYFNWYTNLYIEGARQRAKGDKREAPEGFALLNTTLIVKNFFKTLEFRASVYNLLDKEYVIPTAPDSLPVDFPMPGRSFLLEARYTF